MLFVFFIAKCMFNNNNLTILYYCDDDLSQLGPFIFWTFFTAVVQNKTNKFTNDLPCGALHRIYQDTFLLPEFQMLLFYACKCTFICALRKIGCSNADFHEIH
jgi:hypothetical protein